MTAKTRKPKPEHAIVAEPRERLMGDEPPEVVERHIARYTKAIALAGREGGVWWDVGCGTGYGTGLMPAEERFGFDREFPAGVPESPEATYLKADLTQGGWSSEAPDPDVVLCIETLEHVNRFEQDGVVAEIAARLKPDGVFVLACPIGNGQSAVNPWHKHEPTQRQLRRLVSTYFHVAPISIERYESTSGPARQAFVVCRRPIR